MMSGKIDGMNGQGTQLIRFSGDGSVQPSVQRRSSDYGHGLF